MACCLALALVWPFFSVRFGSGWGPADAPRRFLRSRFSSWRDALQSAQYLRSRENPASGFRVLQALQYCVKGLSLRTSPIPMCVTVRRISTVQQVRITFDSELWVRSRRLLSLRLDVGPESGP